MEDEYDQVLLSAIFSADTQTTVKLVRMHFLRLQESSRQSYVGVIDSLFAECVPDGDVRLSFRVSREQKQAIQSCLNASPSKSQFDIRFTLFRFDSSDPNCQYYKCFEQSIDKARGDEPNSRNCGFF